jgi:hypothetical protein
MTKRDVDDKARAVGRPAEPALRRAAATPSRHRYAYYSWRERNRRLVVLVAGRVAE